MLQYVPKGFYLFCFCKKRIRKAVAQHFGRRAGAAFIGKQAENRGARAAHCGTGGPVFREKRADFANLPPLLPGDKLHHVAQPTTNAR